MLNNKKVILLEFCANRGRSGEQAETDEGVRVDDEQDEANGRLHISEGKHQFCKIEVAFEFESEVQIVGDLYFETLWRTYQLQVISLTCGWNTY